MRVPVPVVGDLDRDAHPGPQRLSRDDLGDEPREKLGCSVAWFVVISIAKLAASADTAVYYLESIANDRDDYYVASGEVPGRWVGSGSALVGLAGEVTPEDLGAILDGLDPRTEGPWRGTHAHRPGRSGGRRRGNGWDA